MVHVDRPIISASRCGSGDLGCIERHRAQFLWYRRVIPNPVYCFFHILKGNRDAFCLFYDAKTRNIKGLNGSGRSPRNLTLEHIRRRGIFERNIPFTDLNSVTVPGVLHLNNLLMLIRTPPHIGAAAAWLDTITRFGSSKVTTAEIFEPAIKLAEEGCDHSTLVVQIKFHVHCPVSLYLKFTVKLFVPCPAISFGPVLTIREFHSGSFPKP
jgi:hypothetical protein